MTTTKEYRLQEDGSIFRVTEVRELLTVPDSAMDLIAEKVQLKFVGLIVHPTYGPVNVTLSRHDSVWVVPITSLCLRAPYKIIEPKKGEKKLTPSFASTTDPVLDLRWTPPDNMKLRFVCNISDCGPYQFGRAWLIAFGARGAAYVLPLANLYDRSDLCLGTFKGDGSSALECLDKALAQFEKSKWNGDLWSENKAEQSAKLFQFDAKTLLQETPPKNWTDFCCDKLSIPLLEEIIP